MIRSCDLNQIYLVTCLSTQVPATHSKDLLADKSAKRKNKIKDKYGRNYTADKMKALAVDWSCTEEECK